MKRKVSLFELSETRARRPARSLVCFGTGTGKKTAKRHKKDTGGAGIGVTVTMFWNAKVVRFEGVNVTPQPVDRSTFTP